jgi:phosphomannomutase
MEIFLVLYHILNNKNITFSKIFESYKKYYKLEEVNFNVENPDLIFENIKKDFGDHIISDLDGLSFDFGNFWFNIRKSNTEPIIRLNIEGIDETETNKGFNLISNYFKN